MPEPGALATAKINPEGNQMELKLGPVPGGRRHVKDTRGMAFCGLAAFVGTPPDQESHIYTATGLTDVTPETAGMIDAESLSKELGVQCMVNGGRLPVSAGHRKRFGLSCWSAGGLVAGVRRYAPYPR